MARQRRHLTALLVISVLALGACGDDDGDDEAAPATTLSPQLETFCADVASINFLEPDIPPDLPEAEQARLQQEFFNGELLPLLRKIQAEAPPQAKVPVDEITRFIEERGEAAFEDEGFPAAEMRANEAAADVCGVESTRVTATEYAFQGMPATLESGRRLFRFDNTGKEVHEMVLLRKKPATTESFDQLLALPEEESRAKADFAGALYGFPGTGADVVQADDDTGFLDVAPGQYAIVCFVPVGLTPEAAEAAETTGVFPEAPPHFTRGMKAEFTVS